MPVVSVIVGATTENSAVVVGQVDAVASVRLAVDTSEALSSPTFYGPQVPSSVGMVRFDVTGLRADTRYFYRLECDTVLDGPVGRFRTHPPLGESGYDVLIAAGGDAGRTPDAPGVPGTLIPSRMSNHPVHSLIADFHDPLMFIHLGDEGYYNIGSGETWPDENGDPIVLGSDLDTYRRQYEDVFRQPHQHYLARRVARVHVWDDHDFGPDDSDKTSPGRDNACLAYREREPHYPLPAGSGANPVYHSWQIGRTLFVALDTRADRDPNDDPDGPTKSMLGTAQRTWLTNLLTNTTAEALVVISSSSWLGSSPDSWGGFAHERSQLVDEWDSLGWLDRMIMVCADIHVLAIEDGSNNFAGGFPVFQFAPLDATPSNPPTHNYSLGYQTGRQSGQYGTLRIQDDGTTIRITGTGWHNTEIWNAYTHTITTTPLAPPTPPTPTPTTGKVGAFATVVSGSHRMVVEARVLTTFQTGDNPDGLEIPVLGGRVEMDGTADIQRRLTLVTDGSAFPRRIGDLLLPDGTEIWVRRGVDTGAGILWAPLGYFRIDDVDQADAPDGPITITGYDRTASLLDQQLIRPRQFEHNVSYGAVFGDLVGEVYPDAQIVFDDDLGGQLIGRPLVVEQSRYEPLRTLAQGRGKILHWDGEGRLQIRTAPDPSVPLWEVGSGRDGVLTTAQRRLTRRDVVNAVVVRSHAGDVDVPARAVAIDDGPHSVTRFGGRFGVVPLFVSTPVKTAQAEAAAAAAATLRRRAGLPYQVQFGAVPNPALQPYDPVRVTLRDGSRERHVVEKLTVPLVAGEQMTASTREQRTSRVVVLST